MSAETALSAELDAALAAGWTIIGAPLTLLRPHGVFTQYLLGFDDGQVDEIDRLDQPSAAAS